MVHKPAMSELHLPTYELEQLLEKSREAQARADEHAKATHERFNVFTTLLPAHDEVRLHTRFLHCLLNPADGSHDCGTLFLNLFFATLKERPGMDDKDQEVSIDFPQPNEKWTFEKEAYRAGFGQIDILVEHPGFGIAIENKIYANEQTEQIARYARYLESRHVPGLVLYLTLDGKVSETHESKPYIRISYANHILDWLEKCLRETHDKIPINQVLQQYRAVVLKLTGKKLNKNMFDKLIDKIVGSKESLKAFYALRDLESAVQTELIAQLDEHLNSLATKHKLERVDSKFGKARPLCSWSFGIKDNEFCFTNKRLHDRHLLITFVFAAEGLFFGFWFSKASNNQSYPDQENLHKAFKDKFPNCDNGNNDYPASAWWEKYPCRNDDLFEAICSGEFQKDLDEKLGLLTEIANVACKDEVETQ